MLGVQNGVGVELLCCSVSGQALARCQSVGFPYLLRLVVLAVWCWAGGEGRGVRPEPDGRGRRAGGATYIRVPDRPNSPDLPWPNMEAPSARPSKLFCAAGGYVVSVV